MLVQVILFSARAKGTFCPDSDWDLLVILREVPDPASARRQRVQLEEALRAYCIPTGI